MYGFSNKKIMLGVSGVITTRSEFNNAIFNEKFDFIADCILRSSEIYCEYNPPGGVVEFPINTAYLYNAITAGNNTLVKILSKHGPIREYVDWERCIDLAFATNRSDILDDVLVCRFFTSVDEDYNIPEE